MLQTITTTHFQTFQFFNKMYKCKFASFENKSDHLLNMSTNNEMDFLTTGYDGGSPLLPRTPTDVDQLEVDKFTRVHGARARRNVPANIQRCKINSCVFKMMNFALIESLCSH